MEIITVEVPELGNRTHLVHDGARALVVDPPRHVGAVERAVDALGLEIVAVADTHLHHDFVSGAPMLARRHGADHLFSADERVRFHRVGIRGGDVLSYGDLEIRVLDTPGHTVHHQSFLVSSGSGPAALLSGGSLLHGTVGRTDLTDAAMARRLAGRQWDSARTQAQLPAGTRLLPTHGFGSLCSATAVQVERRGTIADEVGTNPALTTARAPFVDALLAGFGPIPTHYRHLAPINRAGAGSRPPRRPRRVDQAAVDAALRDGHWVVDVRRRERFARAHLSGTINVEASAQLATHVGWLAPWGRPLVLVGEREEDLVGATRDLAQIGVEVSGTHLVDGVHRWRDSTDYRVVDWGGYARVAVGDSVTLDVRGGAEWAEGHLGDAVHVPLHELESRLDEVPPGRVTVHCRSGFRAAIAASLLSRAGRDVVLVADDWQHAVELGLPVRGLRTVA